MDNGRGTQDKWYELTGRISYSKPSTVNWHSFASLTSSDGKLEACEVRNEAKRRMLVHRRARLGDVIALAEDMSVFIPPFLFDWETELRPVRGWYMCCRSWDEIEGFPGPGVVR
jgi:hypothetical protein